MTETPLVKGVLPGKAPQKEDPRLERAREFVEEVQKLKEKDRGRFASLKRNAGNTLTESRNAVWFYGLLNRFAGERDPEIYFLVATLIPLNKETLRGDFGESLRRLEKETGAPTLEKRFGVLLDADFTRSGGNAEGGELAFRLRQTTKLLASKGVGVNWPQLLLDLLDWDKVGKRVQKRWAKGFYRSEGLELPPEAEEVSED